MAQGSTLFAVVTFLSFLLTMSTRVTVFPFTSNRGSAIFSSGTKTDTQPFTTRLSSVDQVYKMWTTDEKPGFEAAPDIGVADPRVHSSISANPWSDVNINNNIHFVFSPFGVETHLPVTARPVVPPGTPTTTDAPAPPLATVAASVTKEGPPSTTVGTPVTEEAPPSTTVGTPVTEEAPPSTTVGTPVTTEAPPPATTAIPGSTEPYPPATVATPMTLEAPPAPPATVVAPDTKAAPPLVIPTLPTAAKPERLPTARPPLGAAEHPETESTVPAHGRPVQNELGRVSFIVDTVLTCAIICILCVLCVILYKLRGVRGNNDPEPPPAEMLELPRLPSRRSAPPPDYEYSSANARPEEKQTCTWSPSQDLPPSYNQALKAIYKF